MRNNIAGGIGFLFACLAMLLCWIPFVGGILWTIGAILSCIGIGLPRPALAWAGFSLSFIWIMGYFIFGLVFGTLSYFTIYPYTIW